MEKKTKTQDLVKYSKHYSEEKLWGKMGNVAKKAGLKTLYIVLLLYYVLIDESTPKKYKAMIIGALGYFIFPLDMMPDVVPMVGYTDDVTALTGVLYAVIKCISSEIKEKAKTKLEEWFGKYDDSEIESVV